MRHEGSLSNSIATSKMALLKKSCNIGGAPAEVWIVEVEKDKFMYGGHGIAEFLGYAKPWNALKQHVKPHWTMKWDEIKDTLKQGPLMTSPEQIQLPANWHPETLFVLVAITQFLTYYTQCVITLKVYKDACRLLRFSLHPLLNLNTRISFISSCLLLTENTNLVVLTGKFG
ncbi:baculovirus repeated ORF [Spodoptera exempta nucleopolyhedrovirus]|uniref:Baculovirus repeated ORF n=1 Tax=Spodoptera exempta nucleopolyhedrovirus TaxID=1242863 RepID=A0A410S7L9_9ABAC|nr:baculovirus repeated ORF [Spodoptera exempta nucleopolyhedrovirus]QAT90314.1 baculovirus repeated ORF [Spodoptera exempta nucleopolyhedrovirus]